MSSASSPPGKDAMIDPISPRKSVAAALIDVLMRWFDWRSMPVLPACLPRCSFPRPAMYQRSRNRTSAWRQARVARTPARRHQDGPAAQPKTDQPMARASCSAAWVPMWELPKPLSPGDQIPTEARPGAIIRIPPPTPDFPGRPTR